MGLLENFSDISPQMFQLYKRYFYICMQITTINVW